MLKKNDLHDIWQPGSDMKSLSTKKLENIIMYCKQIVIGKSSNDKYIYSPLILLEVLRWKKNPNLLIFITQQYWGVMKVSIKNNLKIFMVFYFGWLF